jgi:outer membrane protein OmpA-like peptidoglycan-associated protein
MTKVVSAKLIFSFQQTGNLFYMVFCKIIIKPIKPVMVFLFITFSFTLTGQSDTYSVNKAFFSSQKYDEFSPVYYKNGIVFCMNRNPKFGSGYYDQQNKALFKIYYIDTAYKEKGQEPRLFSKSLTSHVNDGPVTFSSKGDTVYFSRNLDVDTRLTSAPNARNKLGIFYAVFNGKDWIKIRELRINNEWYNVTEPSLSPDGKRLYFASDKPGGFGGYDLYYCQWKGSYWDNPVNLGPAINTSGNEVYPFINPAGELFFSSDGHPGLGGLDIFYSRLKDDKWLKPVLLDSPINSEFDDFGIVTDSLISCGYFSTNRNKSFDIFQFKTNFPQIFYSEVQKENQYCFMFKDTGTIEVDTLNFEYLWNFGDGKKSSGASVVHCFKGTGRYNVKLDIIERRTGSLFFSKLSYNLILKDFEQPYTNSPDIVVRGDSVEFDGLKSYLPGYKVLNYSWDFSDGTKLQGERVKHSFAESGEFMVNLGLTLRSDFTGKIHKTGSSKKVLVLNKSEEKTALLAKNAALTTSFPDVQKYPNAHIETLYSAENELKKDAIFQVELLSSKTKTGTGNNYFLHVPKGYSVKEVYDPDDNSYHYIVDQQLEIMSLYTTYLEMSKNGYKNVHVRLSLVEDPAEKELYEFMKNFGNQSDLYFDINNKFTSAAYIFLDQIIRIINKYPEIKIEVGVFTDNLDTHENNITSSQQRASMIVNYLITRRINSKRLIAKGYGEAKPVAPNYLEINRRLNRRIEFTIVR